MRDGIFDVLVIGVEVFGELLMMIDYVIKIVYWLWGEGDFFLLGELWLMCYYDFVWGVCGNCRLFFLWWVNEYLKWDWW